jgi:multiple sugar transport system permease protein
LKTFIKKNSENILLVIIVLLFIFPIIWTFLTSIKTDLDAWRLPPKYIFSPSIKNYLIVLFDKGFIGFIGNSLITCFSATGIALLLGVPMAYALARSKLKINSIIFVGVFVAYILPPIVLSIPLYVVFARLGMLDRYTTIIITHITFILAFTVWLMRGFFEEIPAEIEESALIDGCSNTQTFLLITLPMARSGLVSTVIFSFILSWNDFMYALVLTSSKTRLVSVAVAQFLTPHGMFWGQMCAAGIIAILPILVFTLFARKFLVRGMSMGGIK